ncbi:hypothetical protein BaRGS_00031214 [Batillaria attramentaria]|uniref:Uncharacterized protein n=1 Tax=Batillaria attramentaria TaxID=370345 RepID=A0ABD0JRA3_9CAEN
MDSSVSDKVLMVASVCFFLLKAGIGQDVPAVCSQDRLSVAVNSPSIGIDCSNIQPGDTILWTLQSLGEISTKITVSRCPPPPANCTLPLSSKFTVTRRSDGTSHMTIAGPILRENGGQQIKCEPETKKGDSKTAEPLYNKVLDVYATATDLDSCSEVKPYKEGDMWFVGGRCDFINTFSSLGCYYCTWFEKINQTRINKLQDTHVTVTEGPEQTTNYTCSFKKPLPSVDGTYSYEVEIEHSQTRAKPGQGFPIRNPATPTHNCPPFVPEGNSVHCTCTTKDPGLPPREVKWAETSRTELIITEAPRSLNGHVFTCTAGGGPSVSYTLRVAYGPDEVYVATTAHQTPTCIPIHVNPVPQFQWTRRDTGEVLGREQTLGIDVDDLEEDWILDCDVTNVENNGRSTSASISMENILQDGNLTLVRPDTAEPVSDRFGIGILIGVVIILALAVVMAIILVVILKIFPKLRDAEADRGGRVAGSVQERGSPEGASNYESLDQSQRQTPSPYESLRATGGTQETTGGDEDTGPLYANNEIFAEAPVYANSYPGERRMTPLEQLRLYAVSFGPLVHVKLLLLVGTASDCEDPTGLAGEQHSYLTSPLGVQQAGSGGDRQPKRLKGYALLIRSTYGALLVVFVRTPVVLTELGVWGERKRQFVFESHKRERGGGGGRGEDGEPPDFLHQLEGEVCTCGVCKNTCHAPRHLPCLHSFCTQCLDDYIGKEVKESGRSYFPCPTCRQPTDLPKNARLINKYGESFPEDTFVSKLSEVIGAYSDDKSCDLCKRRGETSPALNWCMECYDAVCDACTTVHLHNTSTADHVVISLAEMQKLSLENIMKRKRAVPCSKHGEPVKLYCVDCKEPACVQCVAVSHRKCDNCITVADAISANEEDMAEVVIRLQSLPSEDLMSGSSGDAVLEETVRSSRERIKAISADIRQKVEASEKELLAKLEETHIMLKEKVTGKGGPAKDHFKTLRAANDRMQFLLKYGSDVEILQVYDSIKDAMGKMEKTGSQNGVGDEGGEEGEDLMFRVNFMPDDAVKLFQRDYESLGHIQVEDCNSDDGLSSWGVTCTSRDEIIVVDCRNKRMQKFTSNGDLIDHIQISEEPRDVTSCGADDVAITIMKKQIFVVTVSGEMALKKRIKTQKQYDAISFSANVDNFLVSCLQETTVDVISQTGDVIKSFNVDPAGNPIFVDPRYLTFSHEGNYVITDVATNTVKCISPDGLLLFSYQPSGAHVLRKPQGLCTDNIGNIFIADYGNSRVQLITNEGAFQRFVLARESGIHRPVAIHMTSTNKLIVVQSDGMVKLRFSVTMFLSCPGVQLRMTREDEGPLQGDLLVPPLSCQHGEGPGWPISCRVKGDVI